MGMGMGIGIYEGRSNMSMGLIKTLSLGSYF